MMKKESKVSYNKHGQWALEKEESWTPILSSEEPMTKAYMGKKSGTHTISASVSAKARTGGKVSHPKPVRGSTVKRQKSMKPKMDIKMASGMRPSRPKAINPQHPKPSTAHGKAPKLMKPSKGKNK